MRILILTLALAACGVVWAQRPTVLMTAMDTDGDGALSAAEIAAAPVTLMTLDKNGDLVLAPSEVQPETVVNTMFTFDKNHDGRLSKAEVPERMHGIFARADTDKDGFLTRNELMKVRRGPPDLIFRALDANRDGALSEAEIAGSVAALKTLDKNGDGVLSGDEIL